MNEFSGQFAQYNYNDLKQNLIHSVVILDQAIVTFKKTQCRKHYKLLFQ